MKSVLPALLAGMALVACSPAPSEPVVSPTPKPIASVGCVDIAALTPSAQPMSIYKGARECVEARAYKKAFELMSVAGSYSAFDGERVSDPSSKAAIVTMKAIFLQGVEESKLQEFQKEWPTFATPGSPDRAALCPKILALGKPAYYPDYMINHGLNRMRHAMDPRVPLMEPLVKDFDADAAWAKVLKLYLKCEK